MALPIWRRDVGQRFGFGLWTWDLGLLPMITYAGVELCYEDPDGVITAWIEKFLPLEDLRDQTGPAALRSQRPASRSEYQPGVNLPLPAYPDPPRVKLSTLYWPTGAARWARCYLLASGSDVADVLAAIGDANSAAELVFSDQENDLSVTASMYLLPPRKLSATIGGNDDSLYLLPLVDRRWYWQFAESGEFHVTRESTWEQVFGMLQAAVGAGIAFDPVVEAYGIPDPDELSRPTENVAVLLDAVAHSVGQVIVVDLDGSVRSLGWGSSSGRYLANKQDAQPIAGGDFSDMNPAAAYPGQMTVSFQKYREGAVDPTGDLHTVSRPAGEFGVERFTPGTTKVIHSTAFADFTSGQGLPDNASEVEALADQIAIDYYAGLAYRYDLTLASIFPWRLSGYDDYCEWVFGRYHCGDYQVYTRAQSRPVNFGEEEQLQQFADKPVYPSPTRFKLTANLIPLISPVPSGNSATAKHQIFSSATNEWEDTSDQLRVWDPNNAFPGLLDEYGYAEYKADSLRWEITSFDNRFLLAKLNGDLAPGGSAQATIWKASFGLEAATTMVVPVWAWGVKSYPSGARVFLRWEVASNRFYVVGPKLCVLGKTDVDIKNGKSGKVNVYSVPQGQQQGDEAAVDPPASITAFNKFFGFIPKNVWVICEDDGDGFYVTSCIQSDHLLARVVAQSESSGSLEAHFPPTQIEVQIQPSDQAISIDDNAPKVDAFVRFAPVLDGELVAIVWTGSVFTILVGEFSGGILAKNTSTSAVPKGGTGSSFTVALTGQAPGPILNAAVNSPLGSMGANKLCWLSRNRNGFYVTSAEC